MKDEKREGERRDMGTYTRMLLLQVVDININCGNEEFYEIVDTYMGI